MNKELNITLTGEQKELIVREGQALPVSNPNCIDLTGTIEAPKEFWEKRQTEHKEKDCHIVYSYDGLYVKLVCDETLQWYKRVTGQMKKNPDLAEFNINTGTTYQVQQLHTKLKFMRMFFSDKEKYTELLNNLQKQKTSIQTEIEKEFSDRGDKKNAHTVVVTSDMALGFNLTMPLYKGGQPVKFKVDICFDVRDRNIDVWLESVELKEALATEATERIDKVVNYFKEQEIACIEQ